MRNNPKSRASEDSEFSSSVSGPRKANINEGYNAESAVDVTAVNTSSSLVNRKEDGKVLQQLKAYSENNKEASLGCTRVNYDGSMDTRF